jgi:hypothetical protein
VDVAKPQGMGMPATPRPQGLSMLAGPESDAERLERVLLRHGVGVLAADRNRCVDCGRTPLVGEQVHLYGHHDSVVCELCRSLRREPPVASERVRHTERGQTVRLTARAA